MTISVKCSKQDPAVVLRSIRRILKATKLLAVATVGPHTCAHINTAYFSYSGAFDLFFVSAIDTRHVRNLTQRPHVAATVYDSRQNWNSEHLGLQLFGRCWPVTPQELSIAARTYANRFPHYKRYQRALSPQERKTSHYRFYVIRPTHVTLIDEAVFGEEVFVDARLVRSM